MDLLGVRANTGTFLSQETITLNCSISYYSHIGKRDNNEDSVAAFERQNSVVAVVADGLGGHQNGEYASREAVDALCRILPDSTVDEDIMEDAIIEADEAVRRVHTAAPGALTTIAALWIDGHQALAANVGDSRIYQFRDGRVIYQSVDHSVSQLAVLAGEITPQQIRGHRDRNKLTRVLGGEGEAKIAQRLLEIQEGDRFLLCSDGFWEQITEGEMLASADQAADAEAWLAAMRAQVEPRASDNNTAVAVVIFG